MFAVRTAILSKSLILMGCVFTLSACKIETEIPVYSSDIMTVLDEKKPMDLSIEVRVPIPSEDKCDEYGPKAVGLFDKSFREAKLVGCGKADFESFARIQVSTKLMPLASREDKDYLKQPDAVSLVAFMSDDGKERVVGLAQKERAIKAIADAAHREFSSRPGEMTVTVLFNNDERKTLKVRVFDVFWNGTPIVSSRVMDVERREQIRIELSNVKNAAFMAGENIGLLGLPVEQ